MEQDNCIINNARQGRHDAIRELYESTIDYAWFVARRYLKNDADIADVLQEAYISVFNNLHTFDEGRPFSPWLYSIVSRKCLNFIKREKTPALSYDEVEIYVADTEGIMPGEWLEREEKRREVLQIIDGLPDKQRMAITLFYFEQMDISEIAREMGVREGTVKAHLFYGRKNMKDEIITREEKTGMAYLRPAMSVPQLTKLYQLEAESAVVPKALSDTVWSVVIAADKADIRKWFLMGVERGHKHMLIVYDRMDYPDNSDSPYYFSDAESVYEALRDFRRDPMCEVMEAYDLTVDMEVQLNERRAWRMPDVPEQEGREALPDNYPESGLLTSGETRLQFMTRKNAEYIRGEYAEDFGELGAAANPLRVFTDESREFVHDICVYILEQKEVTKATVAAVYWFRPGGVASAHSRLMMIAHDETGNGVLIPLPQHHTVEIDEPYITFDLCYAQGKERYRPVYQHWSSTETVILSDEYDGLGADSVSGGPYTDWESHELYERAMEILSDPDGDITMAAAFLYKAAREGHGDAAFEFGNYWSGHKHDEREAACWYKRAALLGHVTAEECLKKSNTLKND